MKPTAAPPCFPYPGHRTMAEVLAAEAQERRSAELRLAVAVNDNDEARELTR